MISQSLNAVDVTERGLLGDRAYALVDPSDGKVASAKNPRKWPALFDFRAAFTTPPRPGKKLPPVRITLPNGDLVSREQGDRDQLLSQVLGREVALTTRAPDAPSLEEYWPDIEGLAHRETVTDESTLAGTFFDLSVLHLLTTATLNRLHDLYPQGRFEARRFRPNIVVEAGSGEREFVETAWIGQTLAIGDDVRLRITGPSRPAGRVQVPGDRDGLLGDGRPANLYGSLHARFPPASDDHRRRVGGVPGRLAADAG
jgi:hypothetical protein